MGVRELLTVSFVLGFDDEMVDIIARQTRKHSKTCIQNSVLTKARLNERLQRHGTCLVFLRLCRWEYVRHSQQQPTLLRHLAINLVFFP